ncbi:hypothetical protein DH2020_015931 [Rehmannia glutinosa]|uniref:CRM domain-containing protein n=1 Tax=Rehmannia glutinosa TaxID=99300 RepID=A0ABR0WV46_REHGL
MALGRRGVYDGVIEGMHQHWKHREIVKVITMQKKFSQVMYTAKRVEAESGGILVSVVKLKEGHAIIVYRGKNYKRPKSATLNLLNKREALSRSLEIQRLGVIAENEEENCGADNIGEERIGFGGICID